MVALALVVARLVTLSTMEAPVLEGDSGCTGLTIGVEGAPEDGLATIRTSLGLRHPAAAISY